MENPSSVREKVAFSSCEKCQVVQCWVQNLRPLSQVCAKLRVIFSAEHVAICAWFKVMECSVGLLAKRGR